MNSLILYNILTRTFYKAGCYTAESGKVLLERELEETRKALNYQGDIIVAIENYDWRQHGYKDIVCTVRKQLRSII